MEKQTLERILPFLEQVEEVTLFGYGESLEHEEFAHFFSKISSFRNLQTYLLTNGYFLDRFADLLVDGDLTFLAISIDGATKGTYESLRPGLSFEKTIRNVRLIQEKKQARGRERPELRFTFVGMKRNIHEFPELIRLAADLGVLEVKFIFLVAHEERLFEESLFLFPEMYEQTLKKAKKIADDKNI